jgi:hypothetical protein
VRNKDKKLNRGAKRNIIQINGAKREEKGIG